MTKTHVHCHSCFLLCIKCLHLQVHTNASSNTLSGSRLYLQFPSQGSSKYGARKKKALMYTVHELSFFYQTYRERFVLFFVLVFFFFGHFPFTILILDSSITWWNFNWVMSSTHQLQWNGGLVFWVFFFIYFIWVHIFCILQKQCKAGWFSAFFTCLL